MNKAHLMKGVVSAVLMMGLMPAGLGIAAPLSDSGTVVATGLNAPRGVSVDDAGNVYVAESGTGGPQAVETGEGTVHAGLTGQILKFAPDGTKSVAAGGLLSAVSDDGEASGPQGVLYMNGSLYYTGAYLGKDGAPTFGLMKVDSATGQAAPFANFLDYETANNPGGFGIDSNPYGITAGPNGSIYVADAGGNYLAKVASDGTISTVASFGGIALPADPANANPERGGATEADPVPTGAAVAADGTIYVSLLTGFPFPPGGAKVERVSTDGKVTDAATGLSMVVGVAMGPDGNVYASEFAEFSFAGGQPGYVPASGKIARIHPDGSSETIITGLTTPNGLAFDKNGSLYIASNSNVDPTSGLTGELIRYDNATSLPPIVLGMPVTGSGSSFPTELLLASLALMLAGVSLRVFQLRKSL